MINDGKGDAASSLGCLGTLLLLGGLVSGCVGISRADDPDHGLISVLFAVATILSLLFGIICLARGSESGRKNIEETTRPAWKHVSASDVVAAHKRAEEAAKEAARAADSAARAARKSAKRSFWDQLDKDNR